MNKDEIFSGIIGQDRAKNKLAFYLENYQVTGYFPNLILVAPKGCGKTITAKRVAKYLTDDEGNTRDFYHINCASIKNLEQFFTKIIEGEKVTERPTTIFLDEIGALKSKEVEKALLTILDIDDNYKTYYTYDGVQYCFDFKKITFLFATTQIHKVFDDLKDRMQRVDFEEYERAQLVRIITDKLPEVKFDDEVLDEIGFSLRGNGRSAHMMYTNIEAYLKRKEKTSFNREDWSYVKGALDILPYGINQTEAKEVLYLDCYGDMTLTNIAYKLDLAPQVIRQEIEKYLSRMHLVKIVQSQRYLTEEGQRVAKQLKEDYKLKV